MKIDVVLTVVGVLEHLEIVQKKKVLESYIISGRQYMTKANISLRKANTPRTWALKKTHTHTLKMSKTVTYLMASILHLPPVAFCLIDHCMGRSWALERVEFSTQLRYMVSAF